LQILNEELVFERLRMFVMTLIKRKKELYYVPRAQEPMTPSAHLLLPLRRHLLLPPAFPRSLLTPSDSGEVHIASALPSTMANPNLSFSSRSGVRGPCL
jgi:hypothetical protein